MEERINLDEIKAKAKKKADDVVDATKKAAGDAFRWGIENPEKVIAIVGVTATLLKSSQSLIVNHRMRVERNRIDHTYYDPSTGFHWELVRKASNNDRMRIIELKKQGLDTYEILKQLKLIK